MNKSKKLLSMAFAAAVMVMCVAVPNVCSVFAETTVATWTSASVTKTYQGSGDDGKGEIVSNISNIKAYVDATTGKVAPNGDYIQYNQGAKIYIPVYAAGDTISILGYSDSNGDMKYTINGGDEKTTNGEYTVTAADVTKYDANDPTTGVVIVATTSRYLRSITLTTENAPVLSEVTVKPTVTVTGYDTTDGDLTVTFKRNSTGTSASYSASQLAAGIELVVGAEYTVTAKTDSYAYKTAANYTPAAGTTSANIELSKITLGTSNDDGFSFTLRGNADIEKWCNIMGLSAGDVTDKTSGVTFFKGGLASFTYLDSHGSKLKNIDLLSFKATKSGKITVTMNITTYSAGDQLKIKAGSDEKEPVTITTNGDVLLEADVLKGETVTVSAPTAGNLYCGQISAAYTEATLDSGKTNAVPASNKVAIISDGTNIYAVAVVTEDNAKTKSTLKLTPVKGSAAISTSKVYKNIIIGENTYAAKDLGGTENDYIFAAKVNATGAVTAAAIQDNITVSYE